MMYPFMTLSDNTEVVHSEAKTKDGKEIVKVYFEKPVMNGFHHATCWLPEYKWEDVCGFSADEMAYLQDYVQSLAHIIIELAREGGFNNAAQFQSDL